METKMVDKPKLAEYIGSLKEGRDFLQVPVVSASAMDFFAKKKPGAQKLRRDLTRTLHWRGNFASLGRWGRVSLNHVALLGCLATARGWGRGLALDLGQLYNNAGLAKLMGSGKFAKVLAVIGQSLRENFASAKEPEPDPARFVNETLKLLVLSNPEVREIAQETTAIVDKVDQKLSQMRRHFGYVERIDGDEALSVIRTGDRDELRTLDTKMLRAFGINTPKDAFVLHEFQWTQETVVSVCVPAVLLNADARQQQLKQMEAELLNYETPLRQRKRAEKIQATTTAVAI